MKYKITVHTPDNMNNLYQQVVEADRVEYVSPGRAVFFGPVPQGKNLSEILGVIIPGNATVIVTAQPAPEAPAS